MEGQEVNLNQMLERREARAILQNEMLKKYNCPVISFSMNIPGPVKTNNLIRSGFEIGKKLLLKKLNSKNFYINSMNEFHEITGNEILISVNANPEEIKNITLEIENNNNLGRLFDMDVINLNGEKISRKIFRKCLICNKQAQECARSRSHSVKEMQNAVENILKSYI